MQHKIKEVQGYQLIYDDRDKDFKLLNIEGDEVAHGIKSQDEAEKKAEELKKFGFNFPIRAFYDIGYNIVPGRVTSLNLTDRSVRFVPDKVDTRGYGQSKYKLNLSSSRLFEMTEVNESICQETQAQRDNIRMIEDKVKALREKMEKPISYDYFGMSALR